MKRSLPLFALLVFTLTNANAQYTPAQVKALYQQQTSSVLTPADIADFVITDQYTDAHNGVTHIYLRQRVKGIEIFDANSSIHIDRNGKVVLVQNAFVKQSAVLTNTEAPAITPAGALESAGREAGMQLAMAFGKKETALENNQLVFRDLSVSPEPIKLKLFYVLKEGKLRMAYNVEVFNLETNDWWNIRVDAVTGEVLDKNNWVVKCNVSGSDFAHPYDFSHLDASTPHVDEIVSTKRMNKKADGTYRVLPLPAESYNHGQLTLVNSPATSNGSPYGWHDTDGVAGNEYLVTRGNNVYAKEDTLASNNINGFSPNGGSSLTFDFPVDSTWMNSSSNVKAAITNLFYMNNVIHDVFYNYGFTEVAGNFSLNTYGKGGLGKDQVMAEAQDGSGTSNANFSSPVDGQNGRMQMYLWPIAGGSVSNLNLTVNSPSALANQYLAPISQFGSKKFAPITSDVVLVTDSTFADSLGCQALKNGAQLAGKIALIYRGTCTFTPKVLNAQNAGAIAAIVVNNTTSTPGSMTGSSSSIVIPSVMIAKSVGDSLRIRLKKGETVNVTLTSPPPVKSFDSDFDNGVIIHEFGHGISNRLTGGPANSNCLTGSEQAGEGWSDFFCLALTARSTDLPDAGRGIGTFVGNQPVDGQGIRTFKYSHDMAVSSGITYNDIKTLIAPHGVGSVWCAMLWDMFWDMVAVYGFDPDIYNGTGGNNKAIQLVMDGLKLQPCNPGFVDARNAIIKADSINNGAVNSTLLWKAFARRGLGYSAIQGSSASRSDNTEAFDLPPGMNIGMASVDPAASLRFWPNPATHSLYIQLPEGNQKTQITLTDISGRIVLCGSYTANSVRQVVLDLNEIQNGVYFMNIVENGHVFREKILISR